MTEIIHFLAEELQRALASGQDMQQARQSAEVAVRTEYAGERVYIAGLPKQRRAVQLAKLNLQSSRDLSVASGIPVRTIQRLRSGR